jgi:hypothetical protein
MLSEIEGTIVKLFNGKKVDIVEVFSIDENNLSEDFSQQAALMAYFSSITAEAEHKYALAKFDSEQEYAAADQFWRHEKDLIGEKYTEAVIKSLILRDDEYSSKEKKRMQLDYEVNLLKGITRALSQRAEMLISLGAMTRQEIAMTGMNMQEKVVDDLPKELKTIVRAAMRRQKSE